MSLRNAVIPVFALGAALAPVALPAQKPDSGAFFVRLGNDTLAVERYVRSPNQLVAEALLRTPQTRAMKLTVTFKDDGRVSWYEVQNNPVPGVPKAAPVIRGVVTYLGDSARIETWAGGVQNATRTVAAKSDMIPLQLPFYSTYETAIARSTKFPGDTGTVTMLSAAGTIAYHTQRLRGDTVTLSNPQTGTITAHVDKLGHLVKLDGGGTTFKVTVSRAEWLDLAPYATRFAAFDAKGKSIGTLSPRDTAFMDDANGSIVVDYSRPSKRGRAVFGRLVPWGKVWRTGANAATQIEFAQPVNINGAAIPAGKYTLWSIPAARHWQIILNKQTGQWGTVYDEKQDLVRIPVQTRTNRVPVETFKIDVKPAPKGALMTMSWDRTKVIVPIGMR